MIIPLKKIVYGGFFTLWCCIPYGNEKNGCPMFSIRDTCPPKETLLEEKIDLSNYVIECYGINHNINIARLKQELEPNTWLILQDFDLDEQEKYMRDVKGHKNWSSKKCKSYRYWQKGFMNKIIDEARNYMLELRKEYNKKLYGQFWRIPVLELLERPEANGVNLFATCRHHGIILERNPQHIVKKMVIVGVRK